MFDVTGAGDTVVAALAVALGGGMALRDAVAARQRAPRASWSARSEPLLSRSPNSNPASASPAGMTEPQAPGLGGRDIVCVGFADWQGGFWTNQQHLMSRLAVDNRVLFVESLGLRRPQIGRPATLAALARRVRAARLEANTHPRRRPRALPARRFRCIGNRPRARAQRPAADPVGRAARARRIGIEAADPLGLRAAGRGR